MSAERADNATSSAWTRVNRPRRTCLAKRVAGGALFAIALDLIGAAFLAEWSTVASDWITLAEWVKP